MCVCVRAHACTSAHMQLLAALARLFCPWNFPGKNTEVVCHFLLQGIFLTQGLNEPTSPALAGGFFTTEPPGKPLAQHRCTLKTHRPGDSLGGPMVKTLHF